MDIYAVISIAVAITVVIATASLVMPPIMRDKRRVARADLAVKAAHEYLARFEIRARIVASTLADNRIVLMIETPPHKKLRFSFIIEQPIKQFVLKQVGVEVDRLFWRFPLEPKNTQVPDVKYGEPGPMKTVQTATAQAAAPQASVSQAANHDEEDEYFQGRSYHIEEVSWEDFSSVSRAADGNSPSKG